MKWVDINFQTGIISVVRTLKKTATTPIDDPVFESVKTKKGFRAIVMTDELRKYLTWWQTEQKKQRLQAGEVWRKDLDMVFTNWFGGPVNMKKFSKEEFKELLDQTKLTRKIKFHGLRHSFATFLLSEGVHPKIVQEMLGHANINITMDTYSHVIPNMQKEAISKFNKREKASS